MVPRLTAPAREPGGLTASAAEAVGRAGAAAADPTVPGREPAGLTAPAVEAVGRAGAAAADPTVPAGEPAGLTGSAVEAVGRAGAAEAAAWAGPVVSAIVPHISTASPTAVPLPNCPVIATALLSASRRGYSGSATSNRLPDCSVKGYDAGARNGTG